MLVILALGVWAGYGQTQGDVAAEIARQTPARIEEFQELAKGITQGKSARLEEFQELAAEMARKERTRVKGQAEKMAPSPAPAGNRMLLFVTLGDKPEDNVEANRRMLKEIQKISPDAVVVLRGLPKGSRTLGDLFKYIRQITGKEGPAPMLNPVLFRRYAVSVAPTLVYERDGAAVAWARGIVNSQWLRRRVEQDKASGDQGKWGQTVDIAERDFIDEMKSRLAGIDWDAKKEQAVANYWRKQRFLDLPKTKEEKVFYLDATYKVEQDFILPDGKVIVWAGQKIDMFKIVPPTFLLVVFDATDPQQVEWAVATGKEHGGKYRVKYIATRIPDHKERGWESLSRLSKVLNAPVYLLNEPVRDRFKLAHAPSTVRFSKPQHKFEVKECVVR
ncbi:MAG: TrbC family F-type conjugative pilus assembly protein [Syntrophobacterales bacterium]|jgi:conjugal transfer pilus assembly protein TraW|nr:TrbC family F-type conjugative pilus assembly protein [Syntrophobacterales bacterium]